MELDQKIKQIEKDLDQLKEQRNKLIQEKVKKEYINTYWSYNDKLFVKITKINNIYFDAKSFNCDCVDITLENEIDYYNIQCAVSTWTFGWGSEYNDWLPVNKEDMIKIFSKVNKSIIDLL